MCIKEKLYNTRKSRLFQTAPLPMARNSYSIPILAENAPGAAHAVLQTRNQPEPSPDLYLRRTAAEGDARCQRADRPHDAAHAAGEIARVSEDGPEQRSQSTVA